MDKDPTWTLQLCWWPPSIWFCLDCSTQRQNIPLITVKFLSWTQVLLNYDAVLARLKNNQSLFSLIFVIDFESVLEFPQSWMFSHFWIRMIYIWHYDSAWIDINIVSIELVFNGKQFSSSSWKSKVNQVRFAVVDLSHRVIVHNHFPPVLSKCLISCIIWFAHIVKVSIYDFAPHKNSFLWVQVYLDDLIGRVLSDYIVARDLFIKSLLSIRTLSLRFLLVPIFIFLLILILFDVSRFSSGMLLDQISF